MPKPKKEKRAIPLRNSGDIVNSQQTRPSQFLFGEVKRLEDLEINHLNQEPYLDETYPIDEENAGQPANQTEANQSATLVSQLAGQPANQNTGQPVSQLTSPENYPSRRLRKQKGLRLPVQKLEKWELWCYLNKVDFQDAVEQAMDWLTSQPVSHILIDDLEDVGTDDDILIFYHRWTGNRISQKDKDARETVRRFSDDVCKIGIAISIYRAKAKINSFKYCIGAIEEAAATPLENTGNYLKYLEQTILNKKAK